MFVIASIGNCITLTRSEDINIELYEDVITIVSGDGVDATYSFSMTANQFPPTPLNSNNLFIRFTT